jgi:tyrosine-protein phosphatase non-receptor type 23
MHSYLGCIDKRNSDDGIKISCTHFQYAAWAFQLLRDQYSQYGFSDDLNEDIMSFKMNLLLVRLKNYKS